MGFTIAILLFLFLLGMIFLQKKTISELESSICQIEDDYKKETGKIYRWNKSEMDKW